MKKWVLFLVLISVVQVSCNIIPALAQTKEESAIKQVIENFLKGLANEDLDLVMQQISTNYSGFRFRTKEEVDYNKFRSHKLERFKKLDDVSISDVKINKMNIRVAKATFVEQHNLKGYKIDTAESVNQIVRTKVYLVKEGDSWKIVQLEPLPILERQ